MNEKIIIQLNGENVGIVGVLNFVTTEGINISIMIEPNEQRANIIISQIP
jgi:hypothetical protein